MNDRVEALRAAHSATILAFESSCDETAVAIVRDGRKILANQVLSQIDRHAVFGGVVPEIASRMHVEALDPLLDAALQEAGMTLADVDAVAVTCGPGLVGALLTAVSYAKALAYARGLPLVAVNHIEGHVSANYLAHPELEPPFACLVASGGHSHIVLVEDYTTYRVLGQTRDDAAGEAFDKVARVLGLGYPGGPKIDAAAKNGDEDMVEFKKVSFGAGSLDFSFSGIKTGVMNYIHTLEQRGEPYKIEDIAASFQKSVVEVLTDHLLEAAKREGVSKIALAGGVACNTRLRREIETRKSNLDFYCPEPILCTDNAAMIASSAYYEAAAGHFADMALNAVPYLEIDT